MVKVVKHGNEFVDPTKWKIEVICKKFDRYDKSGCGAVLEANVNDIIWRYFRGTHFRHDYTAIQCQECHKYTRVSIKLIPQSIYDLIDTPEKMHMATFDDFQD